MAKAFFLVRGFDFFSIKFDPVFKTFGPPAKIVRRVLKIQTLKHPDKAGLITYHKESESV
ncbi:MAG TPA: hypothetical protein EYQ84_03500 [Nitrospinaceae bacterium]|nr:hypothetical protein [Nitrospinaceae bacterium]